MNSNLTYINGNSDECLIATNKQFGWSERYKMVASDEYFVNARKWIEDGRGISVWVNVDLTGGPKYSKCGHLVFTPGDRGKPHWAYELVETLPDVSRIDFYRDEVKTVNGRHTEKQLKELHTDGWQYDKRRREWYREVAVK